MEKYISLSIRRMMGIAALSLILLPSGAVAETRQYDISVDGIACPFCAYGIEKQLDKIGGIVEMNTDVAAGIIRVRVGEAAILSEDDVRTAVEKAGFSLRGFSASEPP